VLSPDDLALVERDPALPGLALLLDLDALETLLGGAVRRRYLRYKPGTGCVLALDVDGEQAFAVGYSTAARPKLDKTVRAAPRGSVLAVDRTRGVLVARLRADRDLPGLARLSGDLHRSLARLLRGTDMEGADLAGADLTTLSHKPQRRWVGLLAPRATDPVVVRVHRPADVRARHAFVRSLATGQPWSPSLLGADARHGISVLSWLPGAGLHDLLAMGRATDAHVRATGAAVAALHARPLGELAVRPAEADGADLRRAAAAVAALVPELSARSAALAEHLTAALAERRPLPVPAHGDLSADQVVVDARGRTGLIDLDAVTGAEPALDLGSAVAALHVSCLLGSGPWNVEGTAALLLDGYDRPVDEHRLQAQVAAGLLRRAVEPFRQCTPGWRDAAVELVALAERTSVVRLPR